MNGEQPVNKDSAIVFFVIFVLVMAVAALLLITFTGCKSLPVTNGIPNLRAVDSARNIWRGGQPTDAGWKYLKSIGVTNVVKLNEESEATDRTAITLGMGLHYFPISLPQQLGVERIYPGVVSSSAAAVKPNTYVHCEHGEDRTGLIVARYRVLSGWSKPDAEKEMLDDGFHKVLHGLWEVWEDH
jgi:Tyrosine phosphatase family